MHDTILLVEDHRDLAMGMRVNLERAGYRVAIAVDGGSALAFLQRESCDLVLLDLGLPDIDGFEVLRRLRAMHAALPVLVITARREQRDKLRGLRDGADDYITKPFDLAELLARIEVVLRRASRPVHVASATRLIVAGGLAIDTRQRTVTRAGESIDLSRLAFDLLVALVRRNGDVVTRAELLRVVWGYAYGVESRTIDTHVFELRQKLERDPSDPTLIRTIWRVGYRFSADGGT